MEDIVGENEEHRRRKIEGRRQENEEHCRSEIKGHRQEDEENHQENEELRLSEIEGHRQENEDCLAEQNISYWHVLSLLWRSNGGLHWRPLLAEAFQTELTSAQH